MKHRGDWYFEGYEGRSVPGADGRPRRRLVYTGEYYGFARGGNALRRKLLYTLAVAVYLLCYTLNALSSAETARIAYIGMPVMLSVVPAIWLVLGLVCFWPAGEEMTARVLYASLRRMRRALWVMTPLLAVGAVGCVIRFIPRPALLSSGAELLYLLCTIGAFGADCFVLVLLRRDPVVVVRDPEPDSMRERELEEKRRSKHFRR